MKRNNFNTSLLVMCVVATFSFFQGKALGADFELKINLNKKDYLTSEAIYVDTYFYNNTSHNVEINDWDPAFNINYIVKDAGGTIYNYETVHEDHYPAKRLTNLIKANSYYFEARNIVAHWGKGIGFLNPTSRFIPVGDYTVKVAFAYGAAVLTSNEENFSVHAPSGDEVNARMLLSAAEDSINSKNPSSSSNSAIILFDSLQKSYPKSYPKSMYRPMALHDIIYYCDLYLEDDKTASLYSKLLLDDYAQTDDAIFGFQMYTFIAKFKGVGSKNETEMIDYVFHNYPGTRVELIAKQRKEVIEKK